MEEICVAMFNTFNTELEKSDYFSDMNLSFD